MYANRIQSFLNKLGRASLYEDNMIKFLYNDKIWYITYKNNDGYKFYNINTKESIYDGDSCLSYQDLKDFLKNLIKED